MSSDLKTNNHSIRRQERRTTVLRLLLSFLAFSSLLGFGGGLFFGGCVIGFRGSGVYDLRVMFNDLTDESLLVEFVEGFPGQRSPNLKPFGHYRRCDQLIRGHFLNKLVVRSLIKEDQIIKFVPNFAF